MRQIYINVADINSPNIVTGNTTFLKKNEHNSTQLIFTLGEQFRGYRYLLNIKLNQNPTKYTEEIIPVDNKLTYLVPRDFVYEIGILSVEVEAYGRLDAPESILRSSTTVIRVVDSLAGGEQIIPETFVPWYHQSVEAGAYARDAADEAAQSAMDAAVNADAAKASQDAAKISEDNAKLSETEAAASKDAAKQSEDNAKASETTTAQAMVDYLAMLGVDVATLDANGKLSASQIPSIAINDTKPVASVDEMLLLDVQRGDVAIIVVDDIVTDSYILAADDPTVLANWKKLGVSYVAEAGHAQSATAAEDSQKINGHRVVAMTESQYSSAVLDEDTYYIVTPDGI